MRDVEVAALSDEAGASLSVRTSGRARRLSLRVDPRSGDIVLTLPPSAKLGAARRFLRDHRAWIEKQAKALPDRIPFAAGATVPVFGEPHTIVPSAERGPPVTRNPGKLVVTGDARHTPRRIADYLHALASRELRLAVDDFAERIDRKVARITVRDPKTRWGSCSTTGTLSFSWRLVMAPRRVLRYVAAHEVAHLRHPNHGQHFWSLVATLHPGFAEDRETLRRLTLDLNRYGG